MGRAGLPPRPVTHSRPLELWLVPRSQALLRKAAGKPGLGWARAPPPSPPCTEAGTGGRRDLLPPTHTSVGGGREAARCH